MKINLTKVFAISITVISLSLFFTTVTFAVGNIPQRQVLPTQAAARLEGARLRACQAREKAIKTRSERLTELAITIEEKFDAIAKRVKDYYTTKLVPEGKTVESYDALVADIQTSKDATQIALTNAQNNIAGFSCTDNDPKTMLMQFNEDMRIVKSALQEYKTSVKNLIVGVRSVTGQENRTNPTNPNQNSGQENNNRGGNQ